MTTPLLHRTFSVVLAGAVAGLLTLGACAATQAAIDLSAPIPVNPKVKVGTLPNGLTYYIQKNGKPENRAELRLVVKAGSILEDDDQQGLAHFTEHMAFDGSHHFQKHELISYLESIGVKFGADLNAYTSFDETVYILPIPTDKKDNLDTGLLVLEDWAQGVTMTDEAIDQERNVVLEEERMGKGANDRMRRVLLPALFNGSQYAQRLPIGKVAILKSFPHDAIRRFYADWYRPDLMAVVVVGDIEPEQVEKMIRAHFAHLTNPVHERPRNYVTIPARTESSGLVITDKEATGNLVLINYPVQPKKPETTIADYREQMIRGLYTSMLEQRLQELTQKENPPFLGASSAVSPIARGYEAFSSSAVLGRGGVAPAIDAVVQENERVRQQGFSADELDRTKKDVVRAYENLYNEREKTESATYAAEYIRNFLTQESMPGIENEYAYTTELQAGISLAEINRYAQQSIPGASPKVVAYLGSSKEGETPPSSAQLLSLVDAAENAKIAAKDEKTLSTKLMTQAPKAGSIVAERHNAIIGTTELTLSNGVKVVLKPTDFKNDEVLLSAARFGGQSLYDEKDMFNARYASNVEVSMGLNGYTPIDVQKILAGKAARLQSGSDLYGDRISGSSSSADIESMLQLLYLKMTSAREDETLFKSFVSRNEDGAKDAMAHPESVFSDALQTTLYANHPRLALVPKPQDFAKIDMKRAMAIYQARFGSAKDLTFIIVGSFDADKIKPLIATYLASLPTGDIVEQYRDLGIRPASGIEKKAVHAGTEPKSIVTLTFTGPVVYSAEENTRFGMLVDAMNIQLIDVLREKMSLIYSGGLRGSLDRVPYVNYTVSSYLPCAPENVDKVLAATFAEIDKAKNAGPQQADLDKVKQSRLKEYQIALRRNNYWLAHLQDSILYGTDPAEILSYEKRVNAVTTDDLKEAAKRYFNTSNYVQTVLYPEK